MSGGGGNQQQLAQQLAQTQHPQGAPAGGAGGGLAMPSQGAGGLKGQQGQGWSPAFNGLPAPANTQAVYPQLSGGPWNQMTQMLAGPNYQMTGAPRPALAPNAAAPNAQAGAPPSLINAGAQKPWTGYYGSQLQ